MVKYILFFSSIFNFCFSYQYDLSICTILRDDSPHLKEWIEYHRMLGVENFYFCNQSIEFNETVIQARGVSKWIAFIDSNEFLVPVETDCLVDFLKDYEEFGGICVNWKIFGKENIDPDKLLIEQITHCAVSDHSYNFTTKLIIQPEKTLDIYNSYYARYLPSYYQVNTNKDRTVGPWCSIVHDKLRINHYLNTNEEANSCTDFTIQRFVPALRKRMNLD